MKKVHIFNSIFYLCFSFLFISMLGTANLASAKTEDTNNQNIQSDNISDIDWSKLNFQALTIAKNDKDLPNCDVPMVKLDDHWYGSAKHLFSESFGLGYSYNDVEHTIIISDYTRTNLLTIDINSNIATMNDGTTYSFDYPVTESVINEKKTYLVPIDTVLDLLQVEYTFVGYYLCIYTDVIDYEFTLQSKYDDTYSNALLGFYTEQGKSSGYRNIQFIFAKEILATDMSIKSSDKKTTITLPNLQNKIGEVYKMYTSGCIQEVKINQVKSDTVIEIIFKDTYFYTNSFQGDRFSCKFEKITYSIKFKLPNNVKFSKITTTDQYWNKKFIILIPGNHVSFYKSNKPVIYNNVIKKISYSKTASGNTKITVTTSKLQGYKLTEQNGYFTVKVGSPKSIYKNIVLLDAGHGGRDCGAVAHGMKEKTLNLKVLYTYAKKYFESNSSNVKAYWTRHNDTFINLYTRPQLTKKYQADLFVSLHMNSASSKNANGIEVWYSSKNNKKAKTGLRSKRFAEIMLGQLKSDLKSPSRGVRQAGFVVVKNNTVPAVLVELGFLSGNKDYKKLRKTSYQKNAAKSLYNGIEKTFKKYPTGR